MTFAVAAGSYDRFMGRYSAPPAPRFADFARVASGQYVLDVGCGPGALTGELVARLEADRVSAVARSRSSMPHVDATPASTCASRRRKTFRSAMTRSTRSSRSSSSTS